MSILIYAGYVLILNFIVLHLNRLLMWAQHEFLCANFYIVDKLQYRIYNESVSL